MATLPVTHFSLPRAPNEHLPQPSKNFPVSYQTNHFVFSFD
jgi:hypothetical protein